jgi:hypothetical protein
MKRRRRRVGGIVYIRHQIDPVSRKLRLVEYELDPRVAHRLSPFARRRALSRSLNHPRKDEAFGDRHRLVRARRPHEAGLLDEYRLLGVGTVAVRDGREAA